MSAKNIHEMTGDELQSLLKSSVNLKNRSGVRCKELELAPADLDWWKDAKIGMFIQHVLDQRAFKAVPLAGYTVQSCSLLSGGELPYTQNIVN